MDLGEIGWGAWSWFAWLRIGTIGGLLWMQWWIFGFWCHGVSVGSILYSHLILTAHLPAAKSVIIFNLFSEWGLLFTLYRSHLTSHKWALCWKIK
jgi:hypothetical protein